jgi:hypothetical protein
VKTGADNGSGTDQNDDPENRSSKAHPEKSEAVFGTRCVVQNKNRAVTMFSMNRNRSKNRNKHVS